MLTGVCLSVVASKMILSIPSRVMMYVTVAIKVPGYPCKTIFKTSASRSAVAVSCLSIER